MVSPPRHGIPAVSALAAEEDPADMFPAVEQVMDMAPVPLWACAEVAARVAFPVEIHVPVVPPSNPELAAVSVLVGLVPKSSRVTGDGGGCQPSDGAANCTVSATSDR